MTNFLRCCMAWIFLLSVAAGCAPTQTGRPSAGAAAQTAGPGQKISIKEGRAKLPPHPGLPREVANVNEACRQGYSELGRAWVPGSRDAALSEAAKQGAQMVSVLHRNQEWDVLLFAPGKTYCRETYQWHFCVGDSDERFGGGCTLDVLKAYQAMGVNLTSGKQGNPKLCDLVARAVHNLDYQSKTGKLYSADLKDGVNEYLAILKYMLNSRIDPNARCRVNKSTLRLVGDQQIENTMFWDTQDFVKADRLVWGQWEPVVDKTITTEQVQAYLNELKRILVAGGAKP